MQPDGSVPLARGQVEELDGAVDPQDESFL
jgi:hypothetical protein